MDEVTAKRYKKHAVQVLRTMMVRVSEYSNIRVVTFEDHLIRKLRLNDPPTDDEVWHHAMILRDPVLDVTWFDA